MIIDLIEDALFEHRFEKESESNSSRFYVREEDGAIRFAVLHKLDDFIPPAELNSAIIQSLPEKFLSNPSFKKNCDLICTHHLKMLAEFKKYEEKIFAIEEDPHFFKKYFLYYSDAEEQALQGQSFKDLLAIIANKELFNRYKEQPLTATQYSVAAKIFIKLPFLELPFKRSDLVPLRIQAEGAVTEADLTKTYESIQKLGNTNVDDLIKEMITDELENIEN